MNKLEQKIFDAMMAGCQDHCDYETLARVAAKIALEIAYDAYCQGRSDSANYHSGVASGSFEDFKKEIL